MNRYIFILIIFVSITSFIKPPEKRIRKFKKWYLENEFRLSQVIELDSFYVSANYLPSQMFLANELISNNITSNQAFKESSDKYLNYTEFKIKVEYRFGLDPILKVSKDKEDYKLKQHYLIESLRNDVVLINGNDTLFPLDSHFENNYGVTPFAVFHLVFDKVKNDLPNRLIYRDFVFTNKEFSFDFTELKINSIPNIK